MVIFFSSIRKAISRFGFIYLFCSLFFLSRCSNVLREKQQEQFVSWEDSPEVVLAFSKAMIDGIRILMDELLLSQPWFSSMDISILSEKTELLRGKILNLSLKDQPEPGLVTSWRVFQSKTAEISYITTTSFGDPNMTNKSDSLYLDIYRQPAKTTRLNPALPGIIDLVYWRNVADKDPVARLRMELTPDSLYSRR